MDPDESDTTDQRWLRSPTTILYGAIDRFLMLRVSGRGAHDALQGVLSCVSSLRDERYDSDMKEIRTRGGTEWDVIEAVFRLLKRRNLWLQPPRALQRGSELLSAVE